MSKTIAAPAKMPGNSIQEASAGTGKTFALSSRYLELLFCGIPAGSILATTFTRAAAGEILDRIVNRLAAAAESEEGAKLLSEQLAIPLTMADALQRLVGLMRGINELAVGTIDSFFFRLARAFSFELGLPPAWDLADADQLAVGVDRSVQRVLREGRTADLLYLMSGTGGDRRISQALHTIVDELYSLYQSAPQSAWETDAGSTRRADPKLLNGLADELGSLEAAGKQLQSAFDKHSRMLRSGDVLALGEETLVQNVLSGENKYSRSVLAAPVVDLYRRICDLVRNELLAFNFERNQSARELLSGYAEHYRLWQREMGMLGFDDVTRLLESLAERQPDGFRSGLDGELRHLLLDEFQDTSPQQWSVLRPLARSVVESKLGGSFFCVGDPKQSIYGWRGGVAEMFDVVRNDLGSKVADAAPLLISRRSAPPVIEAVNMVFRNLDRVATRNEDDGVALREWQDSFDQHTTVHTELTGCTRLLQAGVGGTSDSNGEDNGEDNKTLIDELAVQSVRRLADRPDIGIGVLVRTHEDAARIIFRLRQLNVPCSEEGGNPLTDSAAVNVILAALRLADHPADSVAGFLISHSPLSKLLGIEPPKTGQDEQFDQSSHRVSQDLRERIYRNGYGATCQWLAAPLFAAGTTRERGRIELLVNMATEYDLRWSARTSDFVRYVEQTRISDPTSARVRVMTIHRAKGLEFDAVVAPMYGTKAVWTSHHPTTAYSRDAGTRHIDQILRYTNQKLRNFLPPGMSAVCSAYEQSTVRESLCLLYVLLTRAVRDLTVIVGPKSKATQSSVEGVMMSTMGGCGNASESAATVYQTGDPDWFRNTEVKLSEPVTSEKSPLYCVAPETSAGSLPKIAVRSGRGTGWIAPSSSTNRKSVRARDLLDSDTIAARVTQTDTSGFSRRQRGTALHAMFERIKWLDGTWKPQDLDRIAIELVGDADAAKALADEFATLVRRPGLQQLLVREKYLEHVRTRLIPPDHTLMEAVALEIINECRLVTEVDGVMIEGAIDRLILVREGNRLLAAELIDFKTDNVPAEAVRVRAQLYIEQMQMYRRGASLWLGLPPDRIHGRLAFVVPDVVVV